MINALLLNNQLNSLVKMFPASREMDGNQASVKSSTDSSCSLEIEATSRSVSASAVDEEEKVEGIREPLEPSILPRAGQPEEEKKSASVKQEPRKSCGCVPRLLIVDDNAFNILPITL